MKTSKLVTLVALVILLSIFPIVTVYKWVSWVNLVDDKEFRGTIVNLSSSMSNGKYPRQEEYVLVAWEDGSRTYFEVSPVHTLTKGDIWVTSVDQSYFGACDYCRGELPESIKPPVWVSVGSFFLGAAFFSILSTGAVFGIVAMFVWVFKK